MIYLAIALIIRVALDGYFMNQIYKHEIAIAELLKRHPDMLIGGEDDRNR